MWSWATSTSRTSTSGTPTVSKDPGVSISTCRFPPGKRVGLVGMSGAGKTTLTKLLLRLADIQEGEILVDGQNVADVTQQSLRRQIAYVPQEALLFPPFHCREHRLRAARCH